MTQPLLIRRIVEEIPEVKTFWLEPSRPLPYQAGQYLTLLQPRYPELRRSYSMSSTPGLDAGLAITVRRVANGLFSRWLIDEAQVGDELLTTGAGGLFTLPDPNQLPYEQVLLFAAGSGITPVYSLLKEVLYHQPTVRVLLVYSNRTVAATIFGTELRQLAAQFPGRFALELLYSDHPNLARARLYKDLLVQLVRQHATTTPDRMLAFSCGPGEYMRMCGYGLHAAGLPPTRIRRENFVLPPPLKRALPPDTATHRVVIETPHQTHTVVVSYPDTILKAARAQGVLLPYSCEAGVCGSCTMRCLEGQVWHSYNEVLTDRDLAHGLCLTCTGHPVGGDVRLTF
ncbi:ferredoxin--NADP reductase [Hymenobacter sp. HSC-4F20]|uniref:ferredoxin--NADP reductase n=1 Tax=Hymenobacter sp. HSC-4F20 TaxID=2864135 RepID=UPI001C732AEA|nr:ferredoxin--NADP reductase [Hymenobacter sp. HSC-4F20]MBX0292935.1 ferredoxin--NADP reductase [Hymenobacter sp. HSC-4F20]